MSSAIEDRLILSRPVLPQNRTVALGNIILNYEIRDCTGQPTLDQYVIAEGNHIFATVASGNRTYRYWDGKPQGEQLVASDRDDLVTTLSRRHIPTYLVEVLARGIGISPEEYQMRRV